MACPVCPALAARCCEREEHVVDGSAKKTNGNHIMKCVEVCLAFIIYCTREPLEVFKE